MIEEGGKMIEGGMVVEGGERKRGFASNSKICNLFLNTDIYAVVNYTALNPLINRLGYTFHQPLW